MDRAEALTDPAPAAALGASRGRVLDIVRAAPGPLAADDVASRSGLHVNTVRFHLEGLAEAGLVVRGTEGAGRGGRPRVVYQARPANQTPGPRSYRLLSETLTTLVAERVPEPASAALQAGRVWGGYLTGRPAPFERLDADDALERLTGLLAEMGFAPDAEDAGGGAGRTVSLRHCPFLEVADHHRDIVGALHLGLMQGALAELRAPLSADRLDPFVRPNLCIAHLTSPRRNR